MPSSLKLVVFDCDGVMFDSIAANRAYYNDILAHFGHPAMDEEELRYVHVQHVADSIRFIFRKYPADYAAADSYRRSLDYSPYLKFMRMEPDLPEFLDFLRPTYRTAISTNRSTTMATVLQIFKLADSFDKVVTALDVTHSKPHPEALHQIFTHFGLTADEAIYIGDSQVDREHCQAVNLRMIAFKNRQLPADFHVESFMEITGLPIF
ncbi:MAG: HAD family hydrolase [Desulfobulbaceae bacterium]|nr:HAD family hydrolase [Desulfobulbaceae bacterium]